MMRFTLTQRTVCTTRLLALLTLLAAPLSAVAAENYMDYYREARAAQAKRDLPLAEEKVMKALELNPNHPPSVALLHQLKQLKPKGAGLEARYSAVRIPIVEFKDATVKSCLEYLRVQAGRVSDGTVEPNLVYNMPGDMLEDKRISLRLQNVPLLVALRYVADLAGAQMVLEEHAILLNGPGEYLPTLNKVQLRPNLALGAVTLSSVDFTDVPLRQAFETMRELAKRDSQGTIEPNIIVATPDSEMAGKTVSLNLKNVPFYEALRYLTGLADSEFTVGTYAITISALENSRPAEKAVTDPTVGGDDNAQVGSSAPFSSEGGGTNSGGSGKSLFP